MQWGTAVMVVPRQLIGVIMGMKRWIMKLELSEIFTKLNDGVITPCMGALLVSEAIERLTPLRCFDRLDEYSRYKAEELIEEWRMVSTDEELDAEGFDFLMSMTYDWADEGRVCWIETIK